MGIPRPRINNRPVSSVFQVDSPHVSSSQCSNLPQEASLSLSSCQSSGHSHSRHCAPGRRGTADWPSLVMQRQSHSAAQWVPWETEWRGHWGSIVSLLPEEAGHLWWGWTTGGAAVCKVSPLSTVKLMFLVLVGVQELFSRVLLSSDPVSRPHRHYSHYNRKQICLNCPLRTQKSGSGDEDESRRHGITSLP